MRSLQTKRSSVGVKLAVAGLAVGAFGAGIASAQDDGTGSDPFASYPPTRVLVGLVRDFRESTLPSGHPDFEYVPGRGFGHYKHIVADQLGADGLPVFKSRGNKVLSDAMDAEGNKIIGPKAYLHRKNGDTDGSEESIDGAAVNSADTFWSWFRPCDGINMSGLLPIELNRVPFSDHYVFDDKLDTQYTDLEGFYMPNDMFYNAQGGNKVWGFTFMLNTEFEYDATGGQMFSFAGDDDLWVYLNDKLVIDCGGVHEEAIEQTVELDRFQFDDGSGLVNGETYSLKVFFAERNKPTSRFRIETNLKLRNVDLPTVSAIFD